VEEDPEVPDKYYVRYSFSVGSKTFSNEHRTHGEDYRSAKENKELEIWYLPSNPDISRIGGKIHPDFLFFTVVLLILCIPYQGYSIYLGISRMREVRSVLRRSEPVDLN
jgi:hypothetical protein